MRAFERHAIECAVVDAQGDTKIAARQLGIERCQLQRKMKLLPRFVEPPAPEEPPPSEPIAAAPVEPPPTPSDKPFAWAIRLNGDRMEIGACWTVDELEQEIKSPTTAWLLCQHADALRILRHMNTTLAVRAAVGTRQNRVDARCPLRV